MSFHIFMGQSLDTSPRMWRKLICIDRTALVLGNISTCVEKTPSLLPFPGNPEKHLHMRGENNLELSKVFGDEETSPHAWRKLHFKWNMGERRRNISTCVEKTIRICQ